MTVLSPSPLDQLSDERVVGRDTAIVHRPTHRRMCVIELNIPTMAAKFVPAGTEQGLVAVVVPEKRDSDPEDPSARSHCEIVTSSHSKNDTYYCRKDYYIQLQTISVLLSCFFYFPEIGSFEAKQILKPCRVGTFLIRDSSDPRYLYTISVKTKRGPTSIRVSYEHGRFSLDSDEKAKHQMPKFTSIMDLIDYYVRITNKRSHDRCRFLDKSGRKDLPILLNEPKLKEVPSLKHLCRSSINRNIPAKSSDEVLLVADKLPLPRLLQSYLKDYPYIC